MCRSFMTGNFLQRCKFLFYLRIHRLYNGHKNGGREGVKKQCVWETAYFLWLMTFTYTHESPSLPGIVFHGLVLKVALTGAMAGV